MPHVLQFPGGLRRPGSAQITKLAFETVGRAHHRVRIGVDDGLLAAFAAASDDSSRKIWQSSRKKFFIAAQPIQSLGFGPQDIFPEGAGAERRIVHLRNWTAFFQYR